MASSVLPTAVGPTMRMRGGWLERILKMRDLRFHSHFSFDSDYIDLPVIDCILHRVVFGTGEHVRLFSCGHVLFREEISAGGKCLHLDENRRIALPGNDIDFSVRGARVACDNLVASSCQICCDRVFPPLADALVVLRHFMNSSSTDISRSSRLRLRGLVFWVRRI